MPARTGRCALPLRQRCRSTRVARDARRRGATRSRVGDRAGRRQLRRNVEDRVRIAERLVADFGAAVGPAKLSAAGRRQSVQSAREFLYRLGSKTDLRIEPRSILHSEGLLDLQVEDGVGAFSPAQSAAHWIVSVERRFAGTLALRVELYRK